MKIGITDLETLISHVLHKKYSSRDSQIINDALMFAELSGKKSHGIVRLIGAHSSVMEQNSNGKSEIIRKSKLSSVINGKGNPGVLVASLATDEVIRLAGKNDFGIVGTRDTFSTSGCLSYYLEKIGRAGLIGIVMAESGASTPPFGGVQPLFGTNPIGFVVPRKNGLLIFDMGTSAISFGAIIKAKELGKKLPVNVATDKNGIITTDAKLAYDGMTLPFDNSPKGAGLAMMVELLGGLWPGAGFTSLNESKDGWGNLFTAYKPDLLMDYHVFTDKVEKFVETIRNSKTKDGSKVRIPGEQTLANLDKVLKNGFIEVENEIIDRIRKYD